MAARGELPSRLDVLDRVFAADERIGSAIAVARNVRPWLEFDTVFLAQIAEDFLTQAKISSLDAKRIIDKSAIVSLANILSLRQALAGEGPSVIVMRHGTQHSDLASKLDLMRQPQNQTDPLTTASAAQAVVTGVILATIAERSGKRIRVVSSENTRALQTGAIVAGISGGSLVIDNRLTCLDYPPVSEVSNDALLDRLGRENNGAVVWKEEIVDNVFGQGTYKRATRDMADILTQHLLKEGDEIVVVVTHTQQTNACDVYAGDEPLRLRELGMRVFTSEKQVLFSNGVFIR